MADPHHQCIIIEPCTTLDYSTGNQVPAIIHLLTCGHLIAIDNGNRRCGRNCVRATTLAATHALINNNSNKMSHVIKDHLPPLGPTQAHDVLYCETCSGIPIDRWRLMNPIAPSEVLRRCLAVTRLLMQTVFGIGDFQVDQLTGSPYFDAKQEDFSWIQVHRLLCGHAIRTALVRPCASNCVDDPPCHVAAFPDHDRQKDAIICQECVYRAELIFQRWVKVEDAMNHSRESTHASIDPQVIGEYGNGGDYEHADGLFLLIP